MGALLAHITGDAEAETYQPMNVNFGLFPPLPEVKKKQRKHAYTERAKADFGAWLSYLPSRLREEPGVGQTNAETLTLP
jgi:methylenetetrahydrofolate--tRNA-(uracil-5-)-methyltransferase